MVFSLVFSCQQGPYMHVLFSLLGPDYFSCLHRRTRRGVRGGGNILAFISDFVSILVFAEFARYLMPPP